MIRIRNKSDCCGCSTCVNICPKRCIDFVEDEEGFLYPRVNLKICNNCKLCEKVCPVIVSRNISKKASPIVFAAKHRDMEILRKSSSGGMFHVFASWVIDQGGIVYGARYDEDFRIIHSGAKTKDEFLKFCGSKYVQSDLGNTFVEIKKQLVNGQMVLFTGMPCQVAGLKLFLRKEYKNLYTVDLICHGVASPKVFADYILHVQQKKQLSGINMRWKGNWERSVMKLYYTDGSNKVDMTWRVLYGKALVKRPACDQCEFTHFNRMGDVSIADYWGIQKVHPEFYDPRGVSLLLVNSSKGEILLEGIRNKVDLLLSDKDKCLQPRLSCPSKRSPYRDQFWKDYSVMDFQSLVKKYYSHTDRVIFFCKKIAKSLVNKLIR